MIARAWSPSWRHVAVALLATAAVASWPVAPDASPAPLAQARPSLPTRLTNQEFWRLSASLSEPGGWFRSENLVSNEHTHQYVIPALEKAVRPGGVYLGVAPDQNFTYIAAVRPRVAFILDIRRGNLLQHLMYKALFELSNDRADFLARLFSKRRPPGVGVSSTAAELFAAFAKVRMADDEYQRRYAANFSALKAHLTKTKGFALSPEDLTQLGEIYYAFFWDGPSLRYSTGSNAFGSRGFSNFPSFEEMALQTDWEGTARGYLATEANFRFIKDLQHRNVIVPVVGNFAGPKALRAIGAYLREREATVAAFYVSNVEQYLFQENAWDGFAANVATLPVDDQSVFIRSVSGRFGYTGPYQWSDGRASALDPIRALVADYRAGRIRSYYDVNVRSK